MPKRIQIPLQPLTSEGFSAYGEVIGCEDHDYFHINAAQTERYHDLALTQVDASAKLGISLFRNIILTELPCTIQMLERHPLGSQAFIPMQGQAFIIVVAPNLDENRPDLSKLQAFISHGAQGVNYRAGTWHHPLLTLEAPSLFAVVDRIGVGHNCDVFAFEDDTQVSII
ncbi:ureidoglycolate lyase [Acinetobacter calcoaceticus]|uniref:Ureidoglycolate lyase n=1 Tax=Acinetobacter calcoaceticus TaxID=471 RepID=A0A4V2R0A1_ACICA|nr:ureidoglycolate lyase [Acinetobacter calcoaceticus]